MSTITPELRRHLADRQRLERNSASQPCADDLLDALEKAAPFFDEAWVRGAGIRPSSFAQLRYCVMMSAESRESKREARRLANSWLKTARQRYRAGYFANPFGDPVRRPV